MDDCGHIVSQRNYTEIQANLYAALCALLDDVANQEGHDTLALVIFYNCHYIFCIVSLAQYNCYAGNISGYKGYAQRTDNRVRYEADAAVLCIRVGIIHILQGLDDLCSHCSSQTCVQCLSQVFLVADQAFQYAYTSRQIAKLCHLYAGSSVDGRQEVRRIRHCHLLVLAILCNCVIDCAFGQSCDCV